MAKRIRLDLIILLILCVFFILTRFFLLNHPLARDEVLIKEVFLNNTFPVNFFGGIGQPMLYLLPNAILAFFFGVHNWVFRVVPFFSSFLILLLLWRYLSRLNRNHALLITFFMVIFPWFLVSGTQVLQSSLLMLFSFLALIYAEKVSQLENTSFSMRQRFVPFFLTIIFTYLALMTQLIAVALLSTITLYFLLTPKLTFKVKIVKATIYNFIVIVLLIGTYGLQEHIIPGTIGNVFGHATNLAVNTSASTTYFPSFALLILGLWIGPILLLFLYLIFTRIRFWDIAYNIHLLFIVNCILVFFGLNSDPFRPFDRYFMMVIPSLMIFISTFGDDIFAHIIKKKMKSLILYLGTTLCFLIFFSLVELPLFPLEPKSAFVKYAFQNLFWVLVPFSSNGGPLGFYVPGMVLALGWLGAAALLSVSYFRKSNRVTFAAWAFLFIMAINSVVFCYQTGFVGSTSPILATQDIIDHLPDASLHQTVFIYNNHAIRSYLPEELSTQVFSDSSSLLSAHTPPYSVIIVNFPYLAENSPLWSAMKTCTTVYESNLYGVKEGIYNCEK